MASIGFLSTASRRAQALRIGFVPEHFSTPLHFAEKHYGLDAELKPFPTGTGAMTAALRERKIDVAIGLTEGFVADLGKLRESAGRDLPYRLVGTYVQSPLRWAISVGANSAIKDVSDLKHKRVGVSRIGSGSYVMSFVLADQQGWLDGSGTPFDVVELGNFAALRKGLDEDGLADFFMWEHFTTKKWYDNSVLKRVGEIYTPWPSWMIAASDCTDARLQIMADKINQGVCRFRNNEQASIDYITSTMEYSQADAQEWLKTVQFSDDVRGVDTRVVEDTIRLLKKASVLGHDSTATKDMVGIRSSSRAQ